MSDDVALPVRPVDVMKISRNLSPSERPEGVRAQVERTSFCACADTPAGRASRVAAATTRQAAARKSPGRRRANAGARPAVSPDAAAAPPAPARRLIAKRGRRKTPETWRPAPPAAAPGHADAAGAPAAERSVSLRRRVAREGGEVLGGEPRRGHSSALGARRSALGARRSALGARRSALGARRSALLVMQPTRLPNTVERIAKSPGKLWGEPSPPARSEAILGNAGPSRSGPRFDKHGEVRSRSQPIFLKGWLSICEAYPGPILHAQPNPPRKSHRALAPPPAAAETLPAVAPALGWRMRHVADLVPTSPAGRNPDPFPHAMPFRTAIDRDPRCS